MHTKTPHIVVLGRIGAGKGTQVRLLTQEFPLTVIETGKMFREEIKKESLIGKQAKRLINKGHLMPDSIVNEIIRKHVLSAKETGFIIDGYPRNLAQLGYLLTLTPIDIALFINISYKELKRRTLHRRMCANGHSYNMKTLPSKDMATCDIDGLPLYQRDDDHIVAIKQREHVFQTQILPMITAFNNIGICKEINGEQTPAAVHHDIMIALQSVTRTKRGSI